MPQGRDKRLSLDQSRRISRARLLGRGTVFLEDDVLTRLVGMIERDTGNHGALTCLPDEARPDEAYYALPPDWFSGPLPGTDFVETYLEAISIIEDFEVAFECLCEIHKRRTKYAEIPSTQPFSDMSQISPRALLEYGIMGAAETRSMLIWRKFLFDLDNRAAQETGYLFEPILARALGGETLDARNSPIRRAEDPSKGRQVDCLAGRIAYELKLRVTDASSGKGRFSEELGFAEDCRVSGYTPVLLVLDPTGGSKVRDLAREYEVHGGRAYLGEESWDHISGESGPTMAAFVDTYIRTPMENLDTMEALDRDLMDFSLKRRDDRIVMGLENPERGRTEREWVRKLR